MHTWTWEVTTSGVMLKRCVLGRDDGLPVDDVDASDFREANGLLLPHQLVLRAYGRADGKRQASRTTTCKVITYRVGDEANTPERYRIVWPVNTVVADRGTATCFVVNADGPKTIDAEEMLRLANDVPDQTP